MEAAEKGDMNKVARHYLMNERLDVGDLTNIATRKCLELYQKQNVVGISEMSQLLVSDQYSP